MTARLEPEKRLTLAEAAALVPCSPVHLRTIWRSHPLLVQAARRLGRGPRSPISFETRGFAKWQQTHRVAAEREVPPET